MIKIPHNHMSPRFTSSNQNYSSKGFDRGYGYFELLIYNTLYNILYNICSHMVGIPLEGEHLHLYTLDLTLADKYHGKEQIYTRAKDPDCTGINQNQHARQNCAVSTMFTHRRFITGNRDSWNPAKQV